MYTTPFLGKGVQWFVLTTLQLSVQLHAVHVTASARKQNGLNNAHALNMVRIKMKL